MRVVDWEGMVRFMRKRDLNRIGKQCAMDGRSNQFPITHGEAKTFGDTLGNATGAAPTIKSATPGGKTLQQ